MSQNPKEASVSVPWQGPEHLLEPWGAWLGLSILRTLLLWWLCKQVLKEPVLWGGGGGTTELWTRTAHLQSGMFTNSSWIALFPLMKNHSFLKMVERNIDVNHQKCKWLNYMNPCLLKKEEDQPSYNQPSSPASYGQSQPSYEPSSSYEPPESSYESPVNSYQPPPPKPPTSYEAPKTTKKPSHDGYGAPQADLQSYQPQTTKAPTYPLPSQYKVCSINVKTWK